MLVDFQYRQFVILAILMRNLVGHPFENLTYKGVLCVYFSNAKLAFTF